MRPCLTCGRLVQGASYCPRHDPNRGRKRVTPGRSTRAQSKFRAAVLKHADYRCQWVEDGQRCDVIEGLSAHHLVPFIELPSMDPRHGVALCPRHHAEAEQRLRQASDAA